MPHIPVGVQLYTLREDCAKDFGGTLRAVADQGYAGVELAGTYDLSVKELKMLLEENNLEVAGSHAPLEDLQTRLAEIADYNLRIGNTRIVCPYLPVEFREQGGDGYRRVAEILDEVGGKLRAQGLSLSYHNHSFEFGQEGDEYFLDILFEATSPNHLLAELDTYWIQHGGADPVDYLLRYSGRTDLLHIKDMADDEARSFAEVGAGILDWDAIFKAAEGAGVKWYLVEQDICPGPALDSTKKSFDFLASKGIAEARGW